MSNRNFINQVGRFAQDDFNRSKIFPSIKIAQAILESAWGKSELAQKANNLFGIKGTWNGNSYKVRTREEDANGRSYYVNADFRKYPSINDSIKDHSDFFTSTPWRTSNYQPVLNSSSYQEQARALQSSGYATDKQYANKLINLIESNNLASWDDTGGNNVSMTIAVSRGHGGFGVTPGKRSPAGEYEWHFNDKVADAFEAEMKKYSGVKILQVSDPSGRVDTPLVTRTNTANRNKALLYVAFHHNANTGRWGNWTGSEVWVRPGAPQAAKLARNVAPRVARAMNIRNRGVKAGNLHEVREPHQHAILIEGGFMDSTIDITAMRRNDMLAAQGRAVAAGVASYYGLKKKSGNSVAKKPSKPSTPSKGRGTGGAGNIKYKWNKWKTNRHGTHYVAVDATFVVGDTGIWPYENGPFVVRANRAPSIVKSGTRVKFYELRRQDGYVWGVYKTGSGRERNLPIKKWNGGGGRVTSSGLWGKFI